MVSTAPPLIDTWDSGLPGATWDSGLQWDVNSGPSPGDVSPYLDLVTSKHRDKPRFISMLSAVLQPIVDSSVVMAAMAALFDIDTAVGAQLDIVGQWVGVSRRLREPITGVYFTLGDAALGFGSGVWKNPFDPVDYLVDLPDDIYRLLLRAKVLNNHWDGTVEQAYLIWDVVFEGTDTGILIQDLGGMHMLFALTGALPNPTTLALYLGGYLNNVPSGVKVDAYMTPSVPDTPYFGFGVVNSAIAGFGTGAWGVVNHA